MWNQIHIYPQNIQQICKQMVLTNFALNVYNHSIWSLDINLPEVKVFFILDSCPSSSLIFYIFNIIFIQHR